MAGMRYHVMMPFSRPGNMDLLNQMFQAANQDNQVEWYPICHDKDLVFKMGHWCKPCYSGPAPEGWNPMYWKLNWFLTHMPVQPNEFYCVLCDDDIYEPRFFPKINWHAGDVIVCSMKRGNRTPPGGNGHAPTTLIGRPDHMTPGSVGVEQMIIRGKIIKQFRYENLSDADGRLIMEITRNRQTDYAPEAFVWFNYLEPGRW
jgi:hypothetical protein